jgi:two-component system cell cycle sensor histidine kinase/response regulator CckA
VTLPDPLSGPPVTVLIVDDEDLLRHVICRALWSEGYRTLEARSGEDALHLVTLSPDIDLVITDIVMSGIDGRELGRRLAAEHPDLPVLYISAYATEDVFHRGAPDGAAPFLQKPFAPEALLDKVRELIVARRAAR